MKRQSSHKHTGTSSLSKIPTVFKKVLPKKCSTKAPLRQQRNILLF